MHSSTSSVCASTDLERSLANPFVWRAGELGRASVQTVATGYAALDAVLPGGGWPQGALVELLLPQAGQQEWGLLAPGLARALNQPGTPDKPGAQLTALVGAPYLPFGPALGARHIDMRRLISIHGQPGNAPSLLWATREALQCADVGAVLAWLPDARSAHLRRLQIAAHAHHKLLFVFRPLRAQGESSPAPLRLLLEGAVSAAEEGGNLRVHVFKRRGPPLAAPLLLDTRAPRLAALLAASRERARHKREELGPILQPSLVSLPVTSPESPIHALLDRIAHLDPH
ncbi:MAG: translesion DNA synthesis-associated protein ImuA [Polaromonas sp.]